MMLTECSRGDLVAITWPHGSDSIARDVELRGTEQLVQYCGPAHAVGTGKRKHHTAAFVRLLDRESMLPIGASFCCVEDPEVVEVIYSRHARTDDAETDRVADLHDPLAR